MEPIVKYHFDREMVAFVKTLELKPAMFGYEKNDVFNKFKDLLVKARDVCEELVAAEHDKLEAFKESVARVKDDPDALGALLEDWQGESDEETEEADLPDEDRPEMDLTADLQEDSLRAALSEQLDDDEDLSDQEDPDLLSLQEENASLRARLADYADREELLQQAHAIVTEARLEKAQIIGSAQADAEQELFLFRAKRRDEEEAFMQEIRKLEEEKKALMETKEKYQALVQDGDDLFMQVKAYGERLEHTQEGAADVLGGVRFDPPVLTIDEVQGCTEEAMPLCEIAEENPESIFADPDYSSEVHDNVPPPEGDGAGCDYP